MRHFARYNNTLAKLRPIAERALEPETVSLSRDTSSGIPTAWWRMATKHHHDIRVSHQLHTTNERGGNMRSYVRSVVLHELGHAIYSERDSSKVATLPAKTGAPFQLVNIFEDARIEYLMRRDRCVDGSKLTDKTGAPRVKYRWENFWGSIVDKIGAEAVAILCDFIWSEGNRRLIADYKKRFGHTASKVEEYYKRIIACPSMMELEPILAEWVKDFPRSEPPKSGGGYHASKSHDSSTSAAGGSGEGAGAGGEGHGEAEGSGGAGEQKEASAGGGGELHHVPTPQHSGSRTQHYVGGARPMARASHGDPKEAAKMWSEVERVSKMLQPRLREIFRTGHIERYTQAPKGKVSIRHVIATLPTIYKAKLRTGNDRPMTVRLILDCSGSMGATWGENIAAFVHAMIALQDSQRCKIDLWLSGDDTHHIPNPTVAHVGGIQCNGGSEGIRRTLRQSAKVKAHDSFDAVIVVTDGQITDAAVDLKDFHGMPNGFAVYVPTSWPIPAQIYDTMRKQFPLAICRKDTVSLTTAVANQIKIIRGKNLLAQGV